MLIRFTVENFRSFNAPTCLNMAATKISRLPSHVVEEQGNRILKGAFIFGANASGKTNFTRAIDFAATVVRHGLRRLEFGNQHFRLDDACLARPGKFIFDLCANGHFYTYGFSVSYPDKAITGEFLVKNFRTTIFNRTLDDRGAACFDSELKFSNSKNKERFDVYAGDIGKEGLQDTLFLNDVARRTAGDEDFAMFKDVRDWFKRLQIIFPGQKYFSPVIIEANDSIRKFLEEMLAYMDTGIVSLRNTDEDLDKILLGIPAEDRDKIKSQMLDDLSKSNSVVLLTVKGMLVEVRRKGSSLYARKLLINHGNPSSMFEFEDESDGTKRLFDIIPLLPRSSGNTICIVDELDRSLHTKAAIEYIKCFYKFSNGNYSQLIATTHDSNMLDLDLLRQDEIWFIDRNRDRSSKLYSLSQFKERFDKKIEKEYLIGRYGALPIFREFPRMER